MLYSIDIHSVILGESRERYRFELYRATYSHADFSKRIKTSVKKDRARTRARARVRAHTHACSGAWNREFLGDSLARARQSRGIAALARCHGRVKISKSTGFARRATGEAPWRASAGQAARRNNDDDHVGARVPCARVHTARPCSFARPLSSLPRARYSTARRTDDDDELSLRQSENDDRRARHQIGL